MEGKTSAARVESDDVMEKFRLKRFVKHDRGDYYEFEPDGVMINQDGVVWICGADHVEEYERTHHDIPKSLEHDAPWFTLKFPKKVPANMTFQSLKEKVIREAVMEFCAGMKKTYEEEPQGLDDNSNSMVRGGTADAEAHSMDIDPLTNNLDMKELDSALDNCAKGNCAACGGPGSSDELKAHNLVK